MTVAKSLAGLVMAGLTYLVLKSGISLPVGWEASIEAIVVAIVVYFIPNTPSATGRV